MDEQLLDLIYEAAVDPDRWPEVGERFADAVGGGVATLTFRNHTTGEGAGIASRMCRYELDRVWGHFAKKNPLLKITDLPARPRVLTDEEKLPKSELVRTEYYADFLRRNEMHSLLMARLIVRNDTSVVLSVGRRAGLDSFGHLELEIANRFHPHLVRAYRLANRLTGMRVVDGGLRQVVDRAPCATLLVDAAARVLYANAAAESLFAQRSGLSVERGALRCAREAATRRLRAAIAKAAARDRRTSGAMSVEREGKKPLSIMVSPLDNDSRSLFGAGCAVLVCVIDPEKKMPASDERLRVLFGLTPAEATLAAQLLQGLDLKSAARQTNVSFNTTRTHLAHIFQKTGTSRQGELIRLLMMSTADGIR
ncbi:MAG TPA: LuxR C-terminal-related transcriptional regulator [Rhizomicrobium sp.]|jgi:DNA-binding CsgD family transcriptional regulator/PAS domain-containing protein